MLWGHHGVHFRQQQVILEVHRLTIRRYPSPTTGQRILSRGRGSVVAREGETCRLGVVKDRTTAQHLSLEGGARVASPDACRTDPLPFLGSKSVLGPRSSALPGTLDLITTMDVDLNPEQRGAFEGGKIPGLTGVGIRSENFTNLLDSIRQDDNRSTTGHHHRGCVQ